MKFGDELFAFQQRYLYCFFHLLVENSNTKTKKIAQEIAACWKILAAVTSP